MEVFVVTSYTIENEPDVTLGVVYGPWYDRAEAEKCAARYRASCDDPYQRFAVHEMIAGIGSENAIYQRN